jgi:hypothetical protein
MTKADLATFVAERDQVFRSLDILPICAFFQRHGVPIPTDEHTFWLSVHKVRTGSKGLPIEMRAESKRWLLAHGSAPLDDGEVPI